MLGFFLRWSINLLALVIAGSVIPGIRIQSLQMGIIAAGILGLINAVIRPVCFVSFYHHNAVPKSRFKITISPQ